MKLAWIAVVVGAASGCRQLLGVEEPTVVAGDAGNLDMVGGDADGTSMSSCAQRWLDGTVQLGPAARIAAISVANVYDRDPYVSRDELTIMWVSNRPGGAGGTDVWSAARGAIGESFATPVTLPAFNSAGSEAKLSVSADGLLAVISSDRAGGEGGTDIWQATRASPTSEWGAFSQSQLAQVNDATNQLDPHLSVDGLRLYLAPAGGGTQRIVVATRASATAAFATPSVFIDSGAGDADPALSDDERLIVFASSRGAGGFGGVNLWYATRTDASSPISAPRPVPGVNTDAGDFDPALSADACRVYFASDRTGDADIYTAAVSN